MKTTEVLEISMESMKSLLRELESQTELKEIYRTRANELKKQYEDSLSILAELKEENSKLIDSYNNLEVRYEMKFEEDRAEIEKLKKEIKDLKEQF